MNTHYGKKSDKFIRAINNEGTFMRINLKTKCENE